ncbi:MAG: hypothetical protein A3F13_03545 [Gammaproteobacteria bacterium RIFCSPHIGHO2_12_FULL_40_19]|nr:MAG: hypothetical protein A3F13_03545 [Gammaproteobacteria bacterium RIFCSPHIGHO2_12_FULL_40_19]
MRSSFELLQQMVYEVKSRITSSIDLSREDPHQTYPYADGHFDHVPPEHRAYVAKLKTIRDKACQTREALLQSQQISFPFAFGNAIARLGVGECAECTFELTADFSRSELFNRGSLLQIVLMDADNSHMFAIYFPNTVTVVKPQENASFSAWLKTIPENIRHEMILVDAWRHLVQPLSPPGMEALLTCLSLDKLNSVNGATIINNKISAESLQKWNADIELIFQKMCLHPEIAEFCPVKIPYETVQVTTLNSHCTHLKFFAQQRPHYFVDAVTPLKTPAEAQEATTLRARLNTGEIIAMHGQRFFVVRNINDSSAPFGNAEKVSGLRRSSLQ